MQLALPTYFVALARLIGFVVGETHIVRFDDRCGIGMHQLIQDGKELSEGRTYISNGPIVSAVAFLQTGICWFAGDNCTAVETTLQNDDPGSETGLSITPASCWRRCSL